MDIPKKKLREAGQRLVPVLRVLLGLAAGFLAGQGTMFGSLSPLPGALAAGAGVHGLAVWPLALGSCIGLALAVKEMLPECIPLVALTLFFWYCGLRKKPVKPWLGAAVLAAVRLPLLALAPLLPYDVVMWGIGMGLTLAALAAVHGVLKAASEGTLLEGGGETLCLLVLLGLLVGGLPAEKAEWLRQAVLGLTVLLVFAGGLLDGTALSAGAALAVGGILWMMGRLDAVTTAALGLMAVVGGGLRTAGKWVMALGMALTPVVLGLAMGYPYGTAVPWFALLGALLAGALLPNRLWDTGRRALSRPPGPTVKEDSLRLRQAASVRVARFARCFEELSGVFSGLDEGDARPADAASVMEEAAASLCASCPRQEYCWQQEFYRTYHSFLKALEAGGDFPPAFGEQCLRLPELKDRLSHSAALETLREKYAHQLEEGKSLVSRQMEGVCRILKELAGSFKLDSLVEEDRADSITRGLEAWHVPVQQLTLQKDVYGRLEVYLRVASCGGREDCRRRTQRLLSRVMGQAMLLEPCGRCGSPSCRLKYVQARSLSVHPAAEQSSASPGACGDAYAAVALGEQQFMLALSDGMGSGIQAAMQSNATLRLLEAFYQAGFPEDVIFRTVNQVLLLRSTREIFATVDLCLIDQVGGRAKFIKIGACPSYILRKDTVLPVLAPSLPMGILEDVTPAVVEMELLDGDVILMTSDGVSAEGEWLAAILPRLSGLSPEAVCARVLRRSDTMGQPSDDRTVVAAEIRREKGWSPPRALEARGQVVKWRARVRGENNAADAGPLPRVRV